MSTRPLRPFRLFRPFRANSAGAAGTGPVVPDFQANVVDPDTGFMVGVEKGIGTITESRAYRLQLEDFEGVYRAYEGGEPGYRYGRTIRNRCLWSEDILNTSWANTAAVTKQSADTFVVNTTFGVLYQNFFEIGNDLTGVQVIFHLDLKTDVGKSATLYIYESGGSGHGFSYIQGTGDYQRISIPVATLLGDGDGRVSVNIRGDSDNLTISCRKMQVEIISGQSNQNPSEYLKTEAATAVQTSAYYNGNTVANNIVTEARGALLPKTPRLVHEPEATTYCKSHNLTTGWAFVRTDVQLNAAQAPDGSMGATKFIPTIATGTHSAKVTETGGGTGRYTHSLFAKPDGYNHVRVQTYSASSYYTFTINLLTNEITNISELGAPNAEVIVTDAAFGYKRIEASVDLVNPSGNIAAIYAADTDGDTVFPGDGTSGVLIWGDNLTLNPAATPPILNTDAQTTRDACALSCDSANWNDAQGTVLIEITPSYSKTDSLSGHGRILNSNAIYSNSTTGLFGAYNGTDYLASQYEYSANEYLKQALVRGGSNWQLSINSVDSAEGETYNGGLNWSGQLCIAHPRSVEIGEIKIYDVSYEIGQQIVDEWMAE